MAEMKIESEIAGRVWRIDVQVGQKVAQDDCLVTLESMKMEIPVEAPNAGTVKTLLVEEGQEVAEGQALVVIQTAD